MPTARRNKRTCTPPAPRFWVSGYCTITTKAKTTAAVRQARCGLERKPQAQFNSTALPYGTGPCHCHEHVRGKAPAAPIAPPCCGAAYVSDKVGLHTSTKHLCGLGIDEAVRVRWGLGGAAWSNCNLVGCSWLAHRAAERTEGDLHSWPSCSEGSTPTGTTRRCVA